MKNIIIILICISSFSLPIDTNAQDNILKQIESELLHHLKRIDSFVDNRQYNDSIKTPDSIEKENKIFQNKLKDYTEKYPSTIKYSFPELQKEGLSIATSSDGLFRIYSWDTWTGGTMHYFDNIFQFKTSTKIKSLHYDVDENENGGDPKSWYEKIYSLKFNKTTIYLGVWNARFSSSGVAKGIKLFSIDKDNLNDSLKIIKTENGLQNELTYEYNFFSVVGMKERPTITFNKELNMIYLPLVDNEENVTEKIIKYKFTGKYFEELK